MDLGTAAVTTFPVPTPNASPERITAGPDGGLWFTEATGNKIGRITTAGAVTKFALPTANSRPHAITAGPDGNLWFTEVGPAPQRVGRITPTGAISEFPAPGGVATELTTGPDNNIWYTAPTTNNVGRMATDGTATEFFAPGNPSGMATADATSLWYTQQTGVAITRIRTDGTRVSGTPTGQASDRIISGPDGNAWFTESAAGGIGFINVSGAVGQFDLGANPLGEPAVGSDKAIWVPGPSPAQVFRVETAVSTAGPPPPPALGSSVGAKAVSGTVLVKRPGSRTFAKLTEGQSLPVGTVVNTTRGRVSITATSGAGGYSAEFYEGQFQLAQSKKPGATADVNLVGGSFKRCPRGLRSPKSLGSKKPKAIRHLWGTGSGNFRTKGRFSAAVVRGTKWEMTDTCSGTLTAVAQGSVAVRDFVRKRTVVVKARGRYLARAGSG
jgi:streptogramin lyase